MVERRYLNLYGNDFILTKSGVAVLTELGISVEKCKASSTRIRTSMHLLE